MINKSAIRSLLAANFISGVAQGISMISIPMYFAQQGISNMFTAMYAIVTIISVFWSPYGGTLIDKYNRKKIFLILNSVNGLLILGVSLAITFELFDISYLAATVFALTFWNYNLHYPCFYAFMQEITEKKYYSKIASYIEVQSQLASASAGAIAALLLGGGLQIGSLDIHFEPVSLRDIFLMDAATYFVALLIIILLKYKPIIERKIDVGSTLSRLKMGWHYLTGHPYIMIFGIATHAVFVVVLLHVFNLAPLYVEQHLQPGNSQQVFAISEIFYAMGAVWAGVYVQRVFKNVPFLKLILLLMMVTIFEFTTMIFSQSIILFYIMSLLLGVTNAGVRVTRVSFLLHVIPNRVIGRASSIFFVSNALARVALLLVFSLPFFHQNGQVIYAFLILTLFMLVCLLVLIYFRKPIAAIGEEL